MLPKRLKLPVRDFPPKAKTLFRGRYLAVKSAPNNLAHPRLGVVASGKFASQAVLRNSLRRMVFNRVRESLEKVSPPGTDLLVILNRPIIKLDSVTKKAIETDLERVFSQ